MSKLMLLSDMFFKVPHHCMAGNFLRDFTHSSTKVEGASDI
jgi:hypothetical protein